MSQVQISEVLEALLKQDFQLWWYNECSGITPRPGDDHEEHGRRIAEIAWANGAYKAREYYDASPVDWINAGDVRRLARELDVAMNGEVGSAISPALCDVVAQAVSAARKNGKPLIEAHGIAPPDGWVLVQDKKELLEDVEFLLTQKMSAECCNAAFPVRSLKRVLEEVRAMLAAAPKPEDV